MAGAQADVRGTLVAVHFRDERGFAVFSVQQADRSRVRALGHLQTAVILHAVVRIGGVWTKHAQYGWQVRCNTVELVDDSDRERDVFPSSLLTQSTWDEFGRLRRWPCSAIASSRCSRTTLRSCGRSRASRPAGRVRLPSQRLQVVEQAEK